MVHVDGSENLPTSTAYVSFHAHVHVLQHSTGTVDREIIVLKYFRAPIFRGVKFSLSGPSTKIYHRVHITATSTEGLVASAFIVKFGRQLLQKYSCERATATKDGTRCGGKRMSMERSSHTLNMYRGRIDCTV